ncbi:MAG: 50S ribosomal protein L18 [Candidatus Levybacteria bacterium]|nr:50S ribosomal protein L18 [Candidatus Levybacteria bacterium]MBP9814873.1 50S ribosomal protein L18 [Candidatus Levybacteria bacterium]
MKSTKEEKIKKIRIERRKLRTRKKIISMSTLPRLSIFRSNVKVYAQIIDDKKGVTLVSANEKELKDAEGTKINKSEKLGELIAKKAIDKKIEAVVFDKGSYRYHGRVKAFADGARKGGLKF